MPTFIGEIKLFAGNFIPEGWYACNGQSISVAQNTALYSLIGNQFGGNQTAFNLPDLRGRVPVGPGQGPGLTNRVQGQGGGAEEVTLQITQMPSHNHVIANTPSVSNNLTVASSGSIKCSGSAGNSQDPSSAFPAATKALNGDDIYTSDAAAASATMNSAALDINTGLAGDIGVTVDSQCGLAGASQAHENMPPWLCLNYIINWNGIYPSRS